MLRDGLEILRAYLGPELHVCRKLDLDRMVEAGRCCIIPKNTQEISNLRISAKI